MKQIVNVHCVADRHEDLHERKFAETKSIEVEAGQLSDVISLALEQLGLSDLEGAKIIVSVDWPYD